MPSSSTFALIVAAGSGSRFQAALPKPYVRLGGQEVLRRAVIAFLNHPAVDGVQVVIRPGDEAHYARACDGLRLVEPVHGGATRQDSVRLGLDSLQKHKPGKVLIHDAARPLLSQELIGRVVEGLNNHQAVIPGLTVKDTLRNKEVTVDRDELYRVQTPQGFHFDAIWQLHQHYAGKAFTDDAALFEQAKRAMHRVEGEEQNMKLTTQDDWMMMEKLAGAALETRTGMGFDAHRYQPHPPGIGAAKCVMVLCGIPVPSDVYSEGHSDGDAGIHALVDALLGAMGEGDIGVHFPPSDPQWKGADSAQFLQHACKLLTQKSGVVSHADITIICERPRISTYRDAMRHRLADIMNIDVSRVSVKATTTEQMGFTGRGEGIAAQAVATIQLPR